MTNGARERVGSNSSSGSGSLAGATAKPKRQKHGNNQNNRQKTGPVTVETVRRIVAQEGRSARNLISWNAPLDTSKQKPERQEHKPQQAHARRSTMKRRSKSCDTDDKKDEGAEVEPAAREKTSSASRSSSAGKRQVSIRARYWAYLFENLRRAVDEIYATCETDQSVVECKEVLLVLDNYRHDFQALIDWINLQERLNSTDVTNRPTSLAWEVRKSSPGRPRQRLTPRSGQQAGVHFGPGVMNPSAAPVAGGNVPSPHIKRSLKFADVPSGEGVGVDGHAGSNSDVAVCASKQSPNSSLSRTPSKKASQAKSPSANTVTWADKVKGSNSAKKSGSPMQKTTANGGTDKEQTEIKKAEVKEMSAGSQSDDGGGWEKVSAKNKQPKTNRVHFKNASPRNGTKTDKAKDKESATKNKTDIPKKSEKPQIVARDANSNLIIVNEKPKSEKDQQISDNLDFFMDSVGEDSPSTPSQDPASSKSRSPDHMDMVIERSMSTSSSPSSMRVPSRPQPQEETPPAEKIEKAQELNKVLFSDDENDISLQTLDDVEAEYFKSDPTLVSIDDVDDDDEASMLASLDESESKTNKALLEHDASIAAAEQEEQKLMKQIEEEEMKTIDAESEPDQEAAATGTTNTPLENSQESTDWNSIMARFEAEQEMCEGMTWGDMIEEEELREPGRAVQMHEKLSSPSRRRTPAESKRKMEEKQRSATLRRQKMVQDKTERIHILTEKVIDVKKLKDELIDERRELLQELHMEKLQKAEQQRAMKLMKIVQKAQAEETKVNEILFINELQEQNKRHDVLNRILEHDARLLEIQQERSKMQEVKAAKEENVKERRRLLEKERQDRLSELINKRREQDSRIEQLRQEKEKEREKQAREKERERKIRLSALNAAQQEAVTELQKKIQMKHDESERRHQEQLEQRKEKALELSLGRFSLSSSGNPPPLENGGAEGEKMQKPIVSGLDLALDESGEDAGSRGDVGPLSKNSPRDTGPVLSPRGTTAAEEKKMAKEKEARMKERVKAMKKRAKKLKTRMTSRGKDFLKMFDQKQVTNPQTSKNKVYRLVKDINRQLANQKESTGPWPANRVSALDRALGEINRLLEKQDVTDKAMFRVGGGFEMLEQIFEVALNSGTFQGQKGETVSVIPDKTLGNAASTFGLACQHSYDDVIYSLYASRLTVLVDALTQQLTKHLTEDSLPGNPVKSPNTARKQSTHVTPDNIFAPAASALLRTLALVLEYLAVKPPVLEDGKIRVSENKTLLRALKATATSSRPASIAANDVDPKRFMEGFLNRGLDVVSYIVSCGVLDKLSAYLGSVRTEIEADSKATSFITNGLSFLHSVTDFVALRNRTCAENAESRSRRTSTDSNNSNVSADKRQSAGGDLSNHVTVVDPQGWDGDPTQLLPTLYHTEVMGVVSVLYGILLPGAPERPILLRNNSIAALDDVTASSPPVKKIPVHVLQIAMSVMRALNAVADLDIHLLQESLGAEGVSLEFRHICTYLLWYCQHGEYDRLLHEVIVCVGHFALRNQKNQDTVHSGAMPTVLQQLCVLPFAYFSNPRLSDILFPTLIACCNNNVTNLEMLEQEASSCLLSGYIENILEERFQNEDASIKRSHSRDEKREEKEEKSTIALSSSRLYTPSFLRDALRFFRRSRRDLATSGRESL